MTRASRTRPRLRVAVVGEHVPDEARGLGRWLAGVAPRSARGTVDLMMVSDQRIRRYNREFRGVDRVTDVLSFEAGWPSALTARAGAIPRDERPLGDIAIGVGRAARQAREFGHDLRTELRVLALHGLLHLLGYDHERDNGEMQRVEDRLRRRAGLPTGLISRAGAGTS